MFANSGMYRELGKASVNKRKRKVLSTWTYFWRVWTTVFGMKVWQLGELQ